MVVAESNRQRGNVDTLLEELLGGDRADRSTQVEEAYFVVVTRGTSPRKGYRAT